MRQRECDLWLALALVVSIGAIVLGGAAFERVRHPIVLTEGPCTVLGPANHPDLEGLHLVVDCDGVQFGVPAVLP